jgi:hypothetical protein
MNGIAPSEDNGNVVTATPPSTATAAAVPTATVIRRRRRSRRPCDHTSPGLTCGGSVTRPASRSWCSRSVGIGILLGDPARITALDSRPSSESASGGHAS